MTLNLHTSPARPLLSDIEPVLVRGVVRIGDTCATCARPVPVLGLPGKGRPLSTFAKDYFCEGHAMRMTEVQGVALCKAGDSHHYLRCGHPVWARMEAPASPAYAMPAQTTSALRALEAYLAG